MSQYVCLPAHTSPYHCHGSLGCMTCSKRMDLQAKHDWLNPPDLYPGESLFESGAGHGFCCESFSPFPPSVQDSAPPPIPVHFTIDGHGSVLFFVMTSRYSTTSLRLMCELSVRQSGDPGWST